jgi:D-hydroxyproline dehydrogenase subunit beta
MPEQRPAHHKSVLVVGAGAIGASLASELARRGHPVTIVDAGEPGHGTTAASYAWVNSNSKAPSAYAKLNLLGLRAHERWSARTARPWFHQSGNLQIVHSEARMAVVEREIERYQEVGYPARLLTAQEVAAREPGLSSENVVGGAFFPDEGWADTALMCSVLIEEALAHGARLLAYHRVTEVTDTGVVLRKPDGVTERLTADVTVLAAGNGVRPLARGLGLDFPTLPTALDTHLGEERFDDHPSVGMMCTTGPAAGLPRHMIQTDDVSLRPSSNGGVTIIDHPTASRWDADGDAPWSAPVDLLRRARRLCAALEAAEITAVNVGHRVLPSDGVTIADWLDADRRYYAVATHSGITLAPHLAETVAREIGTGDRDASLADFGLNRFNHFKTTVGS